MCENVDFENTYLPAFQYLIPYLRHIGHPGVAADTVVARSNVSAFITKHVKPWLNQETREDMVRMVGVGGAAQVALKGSGWRELMRICRVQLEEGVIKIYKV